MKQKQILLIISASIIILAFSSQKQKDALDEDRFVVYNVNTKTQDIRFYLKDENNVTFGSIENLKNWLSKRKKKLVFAMNAGMYKQDQLPLGLYIENQKVITPINKSAGSGNFYLQPNGVFYINTNNSAQISKTENFPGIKGVKFATQSGPMLVVNGEINNLFKKNSANVNIRNGVGISPDNKIVFAMSKKEVCFYDFAEFFKKLGCRNALYLDGFVSRTYLPEKKWVQIDGNFGAIIGVIISE